MEVEVKLTKEQNDFLLEQLGDDEHVQQWLQKTVDNEMIRMEEAKRFEAEIAKVAERYPEVSFAKLTRIAKHFYELGKNK